MTEQQEQIVVTYTETAYDREFVGDDGRTYVDGLPYRAEHEGLKAAATTQEGAREMIRGMLARRAARPEQQSTDWGKTALNPSMGGPLGEAYGVAVMAPDVSEPERLGILVGAAYGRVMAERDQARMVADAIASQLAAALTHLDHALAAVPEVASSFARTNDEVGAARVFLQEQQGGAVGSPETPGQEQT